MADAREEERTRDREDGGAGASEIEREGMDLLGRESVRDGAIPGVSGPNGDPELRREAYRRNPPELDDVNNMAGDVSQSGGVAGGFRGHGGRSDAGAGDPQGDGRAGPGEHEGTSRLDLDHPGGDVGDDR